MFDNDVRTYKTIGNIRKTLSISLKLKYGVESENRVEKILKIHGLGKDNFDFVSNIAKLINEKLNDISIDDNSNKAEKTIESINQEVTASIKKLVGYDYLYRVLRESQGKPEAKRLMGELYDLSLGLSDSTHILKPYCWALDASKIVTLGREFGQLHSAPTKRISSYISSLCETIHQLSNNVAGAIAVGTFFIDLTHLGIYKHKYSLEDLKEKKDVRKFIENELQQFVHSVNHLSRNGNESPFTNLSIFDREKIKNLINEENFGWYFQEEIEDEKISKGTKEQYIIEYIIELQNIFLDFFDKGDPLKDGAPYRFPIISINISKKENGDIEIPDEEFLNDFCERRDVYRYNIFASEGAKIASCCRLINNSEMLELASQANSFGGGSSISLGSHRVCTINFNRIALEAKDIKDFYMLLKQRIESAGKILRAHKDLLKMLTEKGLQYFIQNGWIQLNRLFSTFGMLGIYECNLTLREKFKIDDEIDVIKDILEFFNKEVNTISKELDIVGNIEQIPAESFASRLVKADKVIYGEKLVPYHLYSNQFIPLWSDTNIFEKMELDGRYNKLVTGGGIIHMQISEHVTSTQAKKLIYLAIKSGAEHFALNAVYSKCEDGHMSFGKLTECPICGKVIIDYFTRVVGFFTPISSWNKERREFDFPNRKFVKIDEEYGF